MSVQSKRVLIVEDDEDFRVILHTKLKASGITDISEAANGKIGIAKAEEIKPDLIIMDVNMPEMNGVEAFMEIRKKPELAGVPCVFLTNYGDLRHDPTFDKSLADEIGATDYFRKTDDLDEMVSKIEILLNRT